jgi:Uma2 family endonuclease
MAIATVQVQRKLFTVDEYEQMIHAGVFGEDDRLELIAGEIMAMSPIVSTHVACVNRLNHLLVQHAGHLAQVSVQNPIRIEQSEPQPDVAVLAPRADYYADELPGAEDVWLLVEVADTSTDYDRTVKIPLYARSGIRETWLIDLAERVVEVYRQPAAAGYRTKQTFGPGNEVAPEALPQLRLGVAEIIPA